MPLRLAGDRSRMMTPRTTLLLALASISFAAGRTCAETPADVQAESFVLSAVSNDELADLSNAVNLPAWIQLAMGRDFSTIEEHWTAVYSPKDSVGAARDWSAQITEARSLSTRATQAGQKRWLGLFIKAGEAVGRKNAPQLAVALRALEADAPTDRIALAANRNFFTAK